MNDKPFPDDLSSILTNSENLSDNEDIKNIKNILKDYGTDIIICKKCNSHILVQFKDFDTFIGKCNCEDCGDEGKKYSIEKDYNQFYFKNDNNDITLESNSIQDSNIKAQFSCKEHGNKFKFYCMLCQQNLCDVCKISHKNVCKIKDPNDFYRFENNQQEILEKINYILECFKLKKTQSPEDIYMNLPKQLEDSLDSDKMNIKRFVSVLIMEYINTPNYEVIQNINNFIKFINNSKSKAKLKSDISNKIIINSESEYLENKNNNLINIAEIKIINKNFDIDLLNNGLENLEKLDLSSNCIKNIKALEKIKSVKLKYLNLFNNYLNNDNIEVIKKLNFPELDFLNLEKNEFSNYNIFEAISHFTKLRFLFLDSNHFIFQKEDEKEAKYNFKSIQGLYLSNGVFSEESIAKIFKKFELEDLVILHLSGNNLKTLSFFKYLKHLKFLNTLILKNNEINDDNFDLEILCSIESLKNINIEYNFLSNDKYIKYAKKKDIDLLILGNSIYFNKFIDKINDINEIIDYSFDKCCEELKKKFEIKK